MMSTSRLRFQHYRASWMFAMLALMFSSFAVTASDHFLINNADGDLPIGPLDRSEDITTARTRLDKNNLHYSLEDTPAMESLEFIVISREYTSNSAASDDLQRLADSGIKDYLYVARGDYADRISVGVFNQHAVAQNRAATLNNLGFAFSVIERFHTTIAAEARSKEEMERAERAEAIKTGDSGLIDRQLVAFIELYAKIEIIKEDADP